MENKYFLRRLRLCLAPIGSRRDHGYRNIIQFVGEVRQASPLTIINRLMPSFLVRPILRYRRKLLQASIAPIQEELQAILNQYANSTRTIIFPSGLDWQTQLFQRPQQLALALARQGALVLYIQPKIVRNRDRFQPIIDRMILCNTPIETFDSLIRPTIYILTWNRKYITNFDEPRVIYDFVDEIETFHGNHAQMTRDHLNLVRSARLVVTTAERLYQQVLPMRPDALLCPNGVDYDIFSRSSREESSPPPDLVSILAQGKPVIGYYGALARWFDYELVKSVARRRNDLLFVLIGPDYDGSLLPSGLLEQSNVYWLGVKPYPEIPRYLRYFDVATIPFQINVITHSTSPLKLFEYMAGGKPVVITPMHESMRFAGVLVASNLEEFSTRIDQALELRYDPVYLQVIDQVARQNTWDARARQILESLGDAI